jgi:Flp pilus assembly protein TadD
MRTGALLLACLAWSCRAHSSASDVPCAHADPAHGAAADSIDGLEARLASDLELPPGCRLALLRTLIHACAEASDPERGLKHVDEALTLAPEEAWLWFKRGVALEQMGALDPAVEALDAALRFDPSHVKSLQWRAHLELLRGRPAAALVDLERAVALLATVDPAGIREDLATLESDLRVEQARALDALGRHAEANAVRDAL